MRYLLVTIENGADGSVIRGIGEVGSEVWDELGRAIVDLDRLRLERANLVRHAHDRYQELFKDLASRPEQVMELSTAERSRLHEELEAAFLGFVLTGRLFIEHTGAALNRRFGGDSPQKEAWTEATHRAYGASFAYRFLYRLRNYVAHSGTRGLSSNIQARENSQGTFDLVFQHLAQPSTLVASWDGWKSLRKELAALDTLDLAPIAREGLIAILALEHVSVAIYADEVSAALMTLHRLRNTVSMYQGPLYLMTLNDDYEPGPGSIMPIPPMPAEPNAYVPGDLPVFRSTTTRFVMDETTDNIRDGLLEFVTKGL